VADGLKFALDLFLFEWVQEHLQVLLSVEGHAGCLACDRCWVALFNINFNINKGVVRYPQELRCALQSKFCFWVSSEFCVSWLYSE
jgi:hypothetical protein